MAVPGLWYLVKSHLFAGWRKRQPGQNPRLNVALPVLGVGIGMTLFIVVLSVMGGFVKGIQSRLLSLDAHGEVLRADGFGGLPAQPETLANLRSVCPQCLSMSPFYRGDVILQSPKGGMTSVLLTGLDPRTVSGTLNLERLLREGDLSVIGDSLHPYGHPDEGPYPVVILGQDLMQQLHVGVGDRITVTSIEAGDGPAGLSRKQMPVVVGDTLSSGSSSYDLKMAYASLDFAQTFFDDREEWSGVMIRVSSPFSMGSWLPNISPQLQQKGFRIQTWMERNKALIQVLRLEHLGMSFVTGLVILVGCFSISITLVLSVKRKSRDFAILRALGFSRRGISWLLLAQGAVVGILGVALGLLMGFGTLYLLTHYEIPFVSSAYGRVTFPVDVVPSEIALMALISVVMATFAAIWPMREALAVDVVDTLRDMK